MNQSILFNDDFAWDETHKHVTFSAQSGGARVQGVVTLTYLRRLGLTIVEANAIVEFCQLVQFDIEEDAQQLIEAEHLDQSNTLELN